MKLELRLPSSKLVKSKKKKKRVKSNKTTQSHFLTLRNLKMWAWKLHFVFWLHFIYSLQSFSIFHSTSEELLPSLAEEMCWSAVKRLMCETFGSASPCRVPTRCSKSITKNSGWKVQHWNSVIWGDKCICFTFLPPVLKWCEPADSIWPLEEVGKLRKRLSVSQLWLQRKPGTFFPAPFSVCEAQTDFLVQTVSSTNVTYSLNVTHSRHKLFFFIIFYLIQLDINLQ